MMTSRKDFLVSRLITTKAVQSTQQNRIAPKVEHIRLNNDKMNVRYRIVKLTD